MDEHFSDHWCYMPPKSNQHVATLVGGPFCGDVQSVVPHALGVVWRQTKHACHSYVLVRGAYAVWYRHAGVYRLQEGL